MHRCLLLVFGMSLLNTDLTTAMNPTRKLNDVLRQGDSVRTLLESAALGILAIDTGGRLVLANNT
ncbi:MAG TPA: hypothetical protein VLM42_07320, partial [Bryobacteraceae bacterium]|nr:hypothetical protein [Bryobacteraceae bacterium]